MTIAATLTTADPARIYERVVDRLVSRFDVDAAIIVGVRAFEGTYRAMIDAASTSGAGFYGSFARSDHGALFAARYIGSSSDRRSSREFLDTEQIFSGRGAYEASFVYRDHCYPLGLDSQARVFVLHGARFVGNLVALRREGAPTFSAKEKGLMNRAVRALSDAVLAADALEQRALPDSAGTIVLGCGGDVEVADEVGHAWLTVPGFLEALRHAARAVDRVEPVVAPILRCAHARFLRLDGAGGSKLLAVVARSPRMTLPRDRVLTETQRKVAIAAAGGATVGEIAKELRMAKETARAHLREVYRRLDVHNRVALLRAIEESF